MITGLFENKMTNSGVSLFKRGRVVTKQAVVPNIAKPAMGINHGSLSQHAPITFK